MATLSSDLEEKAGPSSSGEAAYDVFLSHSGSQKDFAEHLYEELCRANYKPFLDKHSLPPGSHFPSYLKTAARGCKIGVAVLSKEFLTSKWPMIELELLFFGEPEVIPLFYRLSPDDLKRDDNLATWRCKWGEMAKDQEQAGRWEKAVNELGITNGFVKKEKGSEVAYIKKVVAAIFERIPSRVLYDLSSICGHQELTEDVSRHFDALADDPRLPNKPCIVGLYGVGGLGKTTLCKAMVNFYNSRYLGRSCLIEFPRDGDKSTMVQNCKVAIEKLIGSRDHVLKETDDFDQVVKLMKDHVAKLDLFLAFDNVGQNSEQEAEKLLDVGFTAKSKILLTSRSKQCLRNLLNDNAKRTFVGSLPTPEHEVACQIFKSYLKLGEGLPLPVRKEVETFVKRYKFHGKYHPLCLKAVGLDVKKKLNMRGVSVRDGRELSHLLKEGSYTSLKNVDDVIKLSYDELPGHVQQMFLDLVFWIPLNRGCTVDDVDDFSVWHSEELIKDQGFHWGLKRNKALLWLQFFCKEYSIDDMVDELAMAGVIEIDVNNPGEAGIHFHDLYHELALRETQRSPRFFRTVKNAMKAIEWASVERVTLIGAQTMNMRQWQECPRLQLFAATGIDIRSGINVKVMPSLRVLLLENDALLSEELPQIINLEGLAQLEVLCLYCIKFLRRLEGLSALQNLQIFRLKKCPRLENVDGLEGLTRLKLLTIEDCGALMTSALPYLGGVSGLQTLILRYNGHVEKVRGGCCGTLKDGLTGLLEHKKSSVEARACLCPALEVLSVAGDKALKELPNLVSPSLKVLSVSSCRSLRRMPDAGGMPGLRRLYLKHNASLQEVQGYFSPTLVSIIVEDCYSLTKLPDFSAVTGLETLHLRENYSLEEVRGSLSPTLQDLQVFGCNTLKELPDLGGQTCLENLSLERNERLESRGCLSPTLQYLEVVGCENLKELPDLGGLTCLQSLILSRNARLEEWRGCVISHSLRDVAVSQCGALKKMPDLDGLTGLKRLVLLKNASLEGDMGRLSSAALECLVVSDCPLLTRSNFLETTSVPFLGFYVKVFGIKTLFSTSSWLFALSDMNLWHVKVEGDQETKIWSMKKDFPEETKISSMTYLPNLRRLEVRKCGQLEVIEGLPELVMLKEVVLSECPRLVDRNGELSALRGREGLELVIDGCPCLAENSISHVCSHE